MKKLFVRSQKNGMIPFCVFRKGLQVYGFYNKHFDVCVNPVWSETLGFSEGLAAVRHEGRWGYIDSKNRIKITIQYWYAGNFVGGLAPVASEKNSKYGYINKQGFYVIEPRFDLAFDFSEGRAVVVVDNKFFMISKRGKIVSGVLAKYVGL